MTVSLALLAAEGGANNLWNPTIIGVLTVVAAVGLFCGSVYLLLGTNLGARLGFLVAFSGLMAFLVLLTTLWLTSGNSGIDPPHGNSPAWKVVDIVSTPHDSKITTVQGISSAGRKFTSEACASKEPPKECDLLTNVKPAIDAAIVPVTPVAGQTAPVQPFATLGISSSTDYLVDFKGFTSFEQGGGTNRLFWHNPRYAAIEFCLVAKDEQGNNLIPPQCDPLQDTHYAILSYDFGSLRQPVVAYWAVSIILFVLAVLGLHWWEQDERARKRAALTPVPTPST